MKILYRWHYPQLHQFLNIRIINKKIIYLTQRFCNTAFAEIMGNTEGKMGNATVGQVLGKMGKCWGRRRVKRNP